MKKKIKRALDPSSRVMLRFCNKRLFLKFSGCMISPCIPVAFTVVADRVRRGIGITPVKTFRIPFPRDQNFSKLWVSG